MPCKAAVLTAKKKYQKVMDMLPKTTLEEKKEIAQACTENCYRETYDILACLIREDDRDLQLAAIKGFAANKDARATVHLQWLRNKTDASDKEMYAAIADAMAACRNAHREM